MCFDAYPKYQAGKIQNKLAIMNSRVSRMQARAVVRAGADEERRYREGAAGLIGTQRAGFAAQGVLVGTGSAADVQADTARLAELDALTIRNNAAMAAWGYRTQSAFQKYGGDIAALEGKNAATQSVLGGFAKAFIGGAG